MSKTARVAIVNTIIKEIANRGRKFFRYEDRVAEMFVRGNKVYIRDEWKGTEMCLSIPDHRKPKGWWHGGTMMGLVRDFRDYINTGGDTNHNHGYGGLYCQHWGYPEEDMKAIQDLAKSLGYLKDIEEYRQKAKL